MLFAASLAVILAGAAMPTVTASLNRSKTVAAARYLTGRMALARSHAVMRSTSVALRFEWDGRDASMQLVADGNANGVRTSEIASGVDQPLEDRVTLSSLFPGVAIGSSDGDDPVRLGAADLLTFTPLGTATSGTIFIRGEGLQLAVRIFGATARTRIERLDTGTGEWMQSF